MATFKCGICAAISIVMALAVAVSVDAGKRDYCFQVCKPRQIFDEGCCYKYGVCCSGSRREDPNYWSEANIGPMDGDAYDSDYVPVDKVSRRFSNTLPALRAFEDNERERQPRLYHKESPLHFDDGLDQVPFKQQPFEY